MNGVVISQKDVMRSSNFIFISPWYVCLCDIGDIGTGLLAAECC